MSGEKKTDRHERVGVALAHRLVTNAGLIWRDLTGQDIGIDAMIELPYEDSEEFSSRGAILLQVKTRESPIVDCAVTTSLRGRHDRYWFTQRLPILICVVEPEVRGEFSTGKTAYWIDYKSIPADIRPPFPAPASWKLKVPRKNVEVWPPESATFQTWREEAQSFREWLEKVIQTPAEAVAEGILETADRLLGAGDPQRAEAVLKDIPPAEEVLLKSDIRDSLARAMARTYRRLGLVEKHMEMRGTFQANVPEWLKTELIATYWTLASKTPFPKEDSAWQMAIHGLDDLNFSKSPPFKEVERDLIRLTLLVNIKSMFSILPGRRGMAPSVEECDALGDVIEVWRRDNMSKPRFENRLRNALRALCRGRLARDEIAHAESVLADLNAKEEQKADTEILAVSDLLLLRGWLEAKRGHIERARAILECTRRLVHSTGDYLHKWLQEAFESSI